MPFLLGEFVFETSTAFSFDCFATSGLKFIAKTPFGGVFTVAGYTFVSLSISALVLLSGWCATREGSCPQIFFC